MTWPDLNLHSARLGHASVKIDSVKRTMKTIPEGVLKVCFLLGGVIINGRILHSQFILTGLSLTGLLLLTAYYQQVFILTG